MKWLAALWGLAEATFFFIVPDVLLSLYGTRHLKRALVACLYALAGAMLGGLVMYWVGTHHSEAALAFLDMLPSISPEMLERARSDIEGTGALAVLQGPLLGTPYKIYAVQAAGAGLSLTTFLLVSIPARLIRFILVVLLVWWLFNRLPDRMSQQQKMRIACGGWGIFYLLYFALMPN